MPIISSIDFAQTVTESILEFKINLRLNKLYRLTREAGFKGDCLSPPVRVLLLAGHGIGVVQKGAEGLAQLHDGPALLVLVRGRQARVIARGGRAARIVPDIAIPVRRRLAHGAGSCIYGKTSVV